jgi:hypothetical protein
MRLPCAYLESSKILSLSHANASSMIASHGLLLALVLSGNYLPINHSVPFVNSRPSLLLLQQMLLVCRLPESVFLLPPFAPTSLYLLHLSHIVPCIFPSCFESGASLRMLISLTCTLPALCSFHRKYCTVTYGYCYP